MIPLKPHAFHAHLEKCKQCMNQPFNLCRTGANLMILTARDPEAEKAAERQLADLQKRFG